MSHQAVTWALAQPVAHSPAKFILVVMAHHVSVKQQPWTAFASITALANQTGQDRKTVIANVKRLLDAGHLRDTGERTGVTKSVVVFELTSTGSSTETGTASEPISSTGFGTPSDGEAVPDLVLLSSPVIGTASPEIEASSTSLGTASGVSSTETGTAGKPEAVPVFPTEQYLKEVGNTYKKSNAVVQTAKTPGTRGARLPNDWVLPKTWGDEALEICPAFQRDRIREIAAEFRDYWVSVAGSKGCKLDWQATWRNWVRKEAKQITTSRGRGPAVPTGYDRYGVPR